MAFKHFVKKVGPTSLVLLVLLFSGYGCEDPSQGDDTVAAVALPPIAQVGVVVNSVDEAVVHYTKLGLGPFHVMEVEVDGFIYKGRSAPHKLKLGLSLGTPQIELIETIEGETPNTDFLRRRGEGISHYGFNVGLEEYEAISAAWAKEGIRPIFYRNEPERRIAYFNSNKIGGVMIELVGTKTE